MMSSAAASGGSLSASRLVSLVLGHERRARKRVVQSMCGKSRPAKARQNWIIGRRRSCPAEIGRPTPFNDSARHEND
jgi:hypothetical protein